MARHDPLQHIAFGKHQYQLAVRTFIPTATAFGFLGDNRSFSTSNSATYRTAMFLVFDLDTGRITEPLVGNSTGTRRDAEDAKYFTTVKTRLKSVDGRPGYISIRAKMEGRDPFPVIEKVAPNVDTAIDFKAFLKDRTLYLTGVLVGDAFPSLEVFMRDCDGHAILLFGFKTPHNFQGPARLFGEGTRRLGTFRKAVKLGDGHRIVEEIHWFGEEPADVERLSLIRQKAHETPIIPADTLFDFDSANIKPGAEPHLQRWARILNQRQEKRVVIEGHTDATGSADYNMRLSLLRAIAVQSWFVKTGVAGAINFEVIGKGEEKPIASNGTPQGRQQNRRVEIRYR